MNEQIALEEAILRLEELIALGDADESEFQRFFEGNPIVFDTLGYKDYWSFTKESGKSLPKDPGSGLQPAPDFLVQTQSGLFEVFEIKTSKSKNLIVDSNVYRERFTAEVASYISQTTTYEKYFTRNPHNRQVVKELYGLDIQEDLDIKIVIGLNDHLDKVKIHQKTRELNRKIDIITYDDVLGLLEERYQRTYGVYSNLGGFSFHFVVRFRSSATQPKKYFFDFGSESTRNRISFYLDDNDALCFAVFDDWGKLHEVNVDPNSVQLLGQWNYIVCEFGRTSEGFVMTLSVNGNEHDRRTKKITADINVDLKAAWMGSDNMGRNFGYFDLAENFIYARTLTFKELHKLFQEYVQPKYGDLATVQQYIQFDGHCNMHRDVNGNFIQDIVGLKPVYRNEGQ